MCFIIKIYILKVKYVKNKFWTLASKLLQGPFFIYFTLWFFSSRNVSWYKNIQYYTFFYQILKNWTKIEFLYDKKLNVICKIIWFIGQLPKAFKYGHLHFWPFWCPHFDPLLKSHSICHKWLFFAINMLKRVYLVPTNGFW